MSQSSPALPQRMLNEVLGTFLVGTWINAAVFAFELTLVYRYFTLYPVSWRQTSPRVAPSVDSRQRRSDRAWIRVMLLWMITMDITSTVASCTCAYMWLVSGWGNPAMLASNAYLLSIYGVASGMCIFTMHLFLLFRYYTLSRRVIVCAILAGMAFVAWGFFLAAAITAGTVFRNDRAKMKTIVTIWLVFSVSSDWLIAGALTWTLLRIQTNVRNTRWMIARIIRLSILSGSIPTGIALLCLISFMCSPDTNYSLIFSQSLGRACTITVLLNLNTRDALSNSARGTANSNMDIVSTNVADSQGFGRAKNGVSTGRTGDDLSMHFARASSRGDLEMVSREGQTRSCKAERTPDLGLDSKSAIDFDSQVASRATHLGIVLTKNVPTDIGATMDRTRSARPNVSDVKAEL